MNSGNSTFDFFPRVSGAGVEFYILILFTGLSILGALVTVVFYVKRRRRLDELRHKLIPIYSYDPAEQDDRSEEEWAEQEGTEEEQLMEPLVNGGKLSFIRD